MGTKLGIKKRNEFHNIRQMLELKVVHIV